MKTCTAITRRDGALLWKIVEHGPRGGAQVWYAERREGDSEPTGWETWAQSQREAGGRIYPAGTFPRGGLYR
jgi:hypothetical protein